MKVISTVKTLPYARNKCDLIKYWLAIWLRMLISASAGVGELFYLLPQNIFIYADVTPLIWKGENHRLFNFKSFIESIYTENTIINIKSIK
jgi:hypothetical protein